MIGNGLARKELAYEPWADESISLKNRGVLRRLGIISFIALGVATPENFES